MIGSDTNPMPDDELGSDLLFAVLEVTEVESWADIVQLCRLEKLAEIEKLGLKNF